MNAVKASASSVILLLAAWALPHTAHAQVASSANDVQAQTDEVKLQILQEQLRQAKLANDATVLATKGADAKAAADALPSPASGAVDVKPNAGQTEATILTARSVGAVATLISSEVKGDVDGSAAPAGSGIIPVAGCLVVTVAPPRPAATKPVVAILAGSETVGFSHWETFYARACDADGLLTSALGKIPAAAPAPAPAIAPVAVGAAVSIATKLFQILTPNWEIGGIALSPEDSMLAAAFARRYVATPGYPLVWPSRVAKLGASSAIVQAMTTMESKAAIAQSDLDALAQAKTVLADKKAKPADTATAQAQSKRLGPHEKDLTAAVAAYNALATALRSTDGTSGLPLNTVVQEKALADAIGPDGLALWLHIQGAGGGYYTRKVIWNAFGGVPFAVTGGAVVSYTLTRPSDWRVVGAGVFDCYSGFRWIADFKSDLSKPAMTTCIAD